MISLKYPHQAIFNESQNVCWNNRGCPTHFQRFWVQGLSGRDRWTAIVRIRTLNLFKPVRILDGSISTKITTHVDLMVSFIFVLREITIDSTWCYWLGNIAVGFAIAFVCVLCAVCSKFRLNSLKIRLAVSQWQTFQSCSQTRLLTQRKVVYCNSEHLWNASSCNWWIGRNSIGAFAPYIVRDNYVVLEEKENLFPTCNVHRIIRSDGNITFSPDNRSCTERILVQLRVDGTIKKATAWLFVLIMEYSSTLTLYQSDQ